MPSLFSYHTASPHELSFNLQRKMSYHVSDNESPSPYTSNTPVPTETRTSNTDEDERTISSSLNAIRLQSPEEQQAPFFKQESQSKSSNLSPARSPFPAHPLPILTCHSCKAQTVQDKNKNRWVRSCGDCGHKADFSAGGWCGCSFAVVEKGEWEGQER